MCIAGSIFDVCGISYIYSFLKSPFISPFRLKKTRTMRLFPEVYRVIERCDPIDRIILPRRFSRNAEPVFQRFTTQYASRSHRLLSSLECLEREVRACSPSETKFSRTKEWSDEKLRISLGRAERVRVCENDLTLQFIKARDMPHQTWGDLRFWKSYNENCYMRHKWGEHLRSYLDWDWDSGVCLQGLFGVERLTKNIPTEATLHADFDKDNVEGEILNVYIDAILAQSLKTVRVAYRTNLGEIKYRTFSAKSQIGDLPSNPVCNTPTESPNSTRECNNGQL